MGKASQEKINVDTRSLSIIAIYLEGIKAGKGNLSPLGTYDLEQLWNAIHYLNGDVRYKCDK
jgi:hypothetical protein